MNDMRESEVLQRTAKIGLSLDDILLQPQYSEIESRLSVDIRTWLTPSISIETPIIATNMSTVTEYDMMNSMDDLGGVGILHRFLPLSEQEKIINRARKNNITPIVASVGVKDADEKAVDTLIDAGVDVILIDVAHGHSRNVIEMIDYIKVRDPTIDVIAGNVATYKAAEDLLKADVDGIRVGLGGGFNCLTRTVTGHGVPNLTALLDVVSARNKYMRNDDEQVYVPIIMDGGIRNSGDIVKALYFGADSVCLGNLLAGTKQTPGEVYNNGGLPYKKHHGMASKDAQDTHRGGLKPGTAPEGFTTLIPYKGDVKDVVEQLIGGIRSGFTYSGANNIKELRENGVPIIITPMAAYESKILK